MNKYSILNRLIILLTGMILNLGCSDRQPQENQISSGYADQESNRTEVRDFWTHFRAATRYRTNEMWDSAIYEYKKALDINPEHQDALFYLGNMYLETGNFRHAENTWLLLTELNPLSVKAFYQLGNLYLDVNNSDFFDLDKAEEYIRKTAELNRIVTGPQLILARIQLIRENLNDADNYLKAVLGSNDKNSEAHFLRGYIAWKKNNLEKALFHYRKAVESSSPEKPAEGVLSEGDTKSGRSLERPAGQSIFYSFFNDLAESNIHDQSTDLKTKYLNLNLFIKKLNQKE